MCTTGRCAPEAPSELVSLKSPFVLVRKLRHEEVEPWSLGQIARAPECGRSEIYRLFFTPVLLDLQI